MNKYAFTFLLLIGVVFKSSAQKIIYPHSVFWSKLELNQLDKNNKYGVGVDFVFRSKSGLENNNMFAEPLRESIRIWGHYQFSEYARLSISPIGLMHTNEYIAKPEDLNRPDYIEWRSTLQFFHHIKQWDGRIMHTWRYRHEFRFQEQSDSDALRFLMRFRFRYRVRVLLNSNNFYQDKTAYIAISNEIGLNIGKNVIYNTFNQNRLYIGVGYRFLNVIRTELRYVDRFRTRGSTGFEFDHGRGIMLGIYFDALRGIGKSEEFKVRFTD